MSIKQELDAVLHRAAIAPLDDRAFLRVTGADATRWLNGMVTNSVQALKPGEGAYSFLLNAQGRILGDLTVFREIDPVEPASYILATSRQQIDVIQKHLDHFIIMDDVELLPMDYGQTMLLIGPEAPRVLRLIEAQLDPKVPFGDYKPLRLHRYPESGSQLITPAEGSIPCIEISVKGPLEGLFAAVKAAGAVEASTEALNAVRLLAGAPAYGVDITEKYLPQETDQAHALHFNKGCYLGQEIVERIRSRGQVHRLLTPLTLTGELPTEFPSPIEADGKPAGEITSAALVPLPEGDQILALGYVRREALDTHATLTYSGGTAAPRTAAQVQTAAVASNY